MSQYRFYAADVSYFSAKVRPALRYKNIPFVELDPTPEAYRDVILPRTGLAFIPILITPDDEVLQDTSEILDALERISPKPSLYPLTPRQRAACFLIELYADEFMLLPAMHYRWSFPESEAKARQDFERFSGDPETAAHFADRMKGSLPLLGVSERSGPIIETILLELLQLLSKHFEAYPFLLGEAPSLADCALMGPLYAHLYLDAVPSRLLQSEAPQVCQWIDRMNSLKSQDKHFFDGDELLGELPAILHFMAKDAVPLLLDNLTAVNSWCEANGKPGALVPRAMGTHRSLLRGVEVERYTSSYSQWMVQRCKRGVSGQDGLSPESLLHEAGWAPLFAWRPQLPMVKNEFKLVFAAQG